MIYIQLKVIVKGGYHSGGPGYAVSGEAFRRLGKKLVEDYKSCKNSGTDDVDINDCLRAVGARMEKSVDEKGRQRWLCLSLMDFYSGNYPDWLKQYSSHPLKSVRMLLF
jgi:glycoprotein-N-acetylgalactosamine 3-beta-galactosyltransferase